MSENRVPYTDIKLLIKSLSIIMCRLMTEDQTKKELCLACHKALYWALCTQQTDKALDEFLFVLELLLITELTKCLLIPVSSAKILQNFT